MSLKISIVGCSGHASVVMDSIYEQGDIIYGYFDNLEKEIQNELVYLGKENEMTSNHNIFITIGNNVIRENIYHLLKNKNNLDLRVIDPSALISKSVKICSQVYVGKKVVINAESVIKKGCIINTNSVLEHGVSIGEFTNIAPSSTICGDVSIGSNCHIGANSTIIPGISIGDNVVVGAGSVVIRDLESNSKYVGNPVRRL